jgi:hypothetical protein
MNEIECSFCGHINNYDDGDSTVLCSLCAELIFVPEYDCVYCGASLDGSEVIFPTSGEFEGEPLCDECYSEFYDIDGKPMDFVQ